MAEVIVHRRAARYLKRLPPSDRTRIKRALKELGANPFNLPHVRRMVGEWEGYYRLRIGDFRVIYGYDQSDDLVYVDYIGRRGDIYK